MNADINLLPQRKRNIFQSEQMLMRVRVLAILCVVMVIISGLIALYINQTSSPAALKAQEDSLIITLNANKPKAVAQLQLLDRLNRIQKIITTRSTLEKNIQLIQEQLPDTVTLTSFLIDDKQLSFGVSSDDLTAIDKVTSNMNNLLKSKKLIKEMTIENIVADQKSGKYSLAIDASL